MRTALMNILSKRNLSYALLASLVGGVIGVISLIYIGLTLPKVSSLRDYRPPIASKILSKDGTVLAEIGLQNRELIPIEKIPQFIVSAFLAAEDSKFYQHQGVDYLGIFRAFLANFRAGRIVQGGSTITQQVAKALLLTNKRSYVRKLKEVILAKRIEEQFSKQEILFLYLNEVYLGGGYYGIKSAFKGYFDKELEEVSIAETAMVAGLLVAPGLYSPYVNPQKAKSRQEYVLKRLRDTRSITPEQYEEALLEKIKFRIKRKSDFLAGYFTDWIRQKIIDQVGNERFLRDGFKIQTTLNYHLQSVAEKAILDGISAIDKRQGFQKPSQNISDPQEIKTYHIQQREKIYRDQSTYFTINNDFTYKYEIEYDPIEHEKIELYNLDFQEKIQTQRFIAGYYPKDKILPYLKKGERYKAVVTKINDAEKLIHINVMGVSGIIPYSGFSWANKRNISKDRIDWRPAVQPSKILNPGDIILVKLIHPSTRLLPHVFHSQRQRYTNLDPGRSQAIRQQKYLLCHLDQEAEAQAALLAIHPQSGEIVAMVGGVDFKRSQYNRVIQAKRQPGSAFKPILFASALEMGMTPTSIIVDSPETLGGVNQALNWKPRNYDGKFKGPMTLRNALEQSRNIPTIKLVHKLGIRRIVEFSKRIGLNAKLERDLSLSLGSFGVSLMDILTTYGIFPNSGKKVIPKSVLYITDRDENTYSINKEEQIKEDGLVEEEKENSFFHTLIEKKDEVLNPFKVNLDENQVYDPRLAYIMSNLLKGVVWHGTGRSARSVSPFIGGKTGTTNDYVDAWFLGFTSRLLVGVWVGFDNNKTLGWGETGSKSALPIWKTFVKAAIEKYGESDFRAPPGIINIKINKETGKLSHTQENSFVEAFVQGTEPNAEEEETLFQDESQHSKQLIEDDDYYNQ